MCVCVHERARARVCACMCVYERKRVRVPVCAPNAVTTNISHGVETMPKAHTVVDDIIMQVKG